MWLLTERGFFSIVQKRGERQLTVQAVFPEDLDRLREVLPELGPTLPGGQGDLPLSARVGRRALARALSGLVGRIRYPDLVRFAKPWLGRERTGDLQMIEALVRATRSGPAPKGFNLVE